MIKQLVLSENVFGLESFEGEEPSILGVGEVGYLSHFLTKIESFRGLVKVLREVLHFIFGFSRPTKLYYAYGFTLNFNVHECVNEG